LLDHPADSCSLEGLPFQEFGNHPFDGLPVLFDGQQVDRARVEPGDEFLVLAVRAADHLGQTSDLVLVALAPLVVRSTEVFGFRHPAGQ